MGAQPSIAVPTWGEGDFTGTGAGGSGSARLLYSQTSIQSGDTISNTNVLDRFISSVFTIPADTFTLGSVLTIFATGTWRTAGAAPQLQTALDLDGVNVADTQSLLQIANVIDRVWRVEVTMTCTSVGATGSLEIQGYRDAATSASAARTEGMLGGSFTVDTTGPMVVKLEETWSAADPDNSVTMSQYYAHFAEIA